MTMFNPIQIGGRDGEPEITPPTDVSPLPPTPTPPPPPTTTQPPTDRTQPPLTATDVQDLNNHVKYWESQIKQAEDLLNDPAAPENLDRAEIKRNIDTYKAKADLIRQHIEAGVGLMPDIAILTSKEAQPFVSVTKDGRYQVDVEGIVRSGMDPMQLHQIGITDEAIAQVKTLNKLAEYKTGAGGYDLARAIADGKEDLLIEAGFSQKDITGIKNLMAESKQVPDIAATTVQGETIRLIDGTEVYKADMDKLKESNPSAYSKIMEKGLTVYNAELDGAYDRLKPYIIARQYGMGGHEVDDEGKKIKSIINPPQYDIYKYVKENPGDRQTLITLGFTENEILEIETAVKSEGDVPQPIKDADVIPLLSGEVKEDYPNLSAQDKYSILVNKGIVSATAGFQGSSKNNEPLVATTRLTAMNFGVMGLPMDDMLINTLPVVGTVRTWNDMGVVGKTVSILSDILSIIPIVGAMAAGAKGTVAVGRTARIIGAAKGLGRGLGAEVIAPATVILHPIETAKSAYVGLREMVEIVNLRKIPEAVITTTHGTVRLPVNMATSEKQAIKIRDTLMDLVAKGEKPVVEVGGVKYELGTSALMKETRGGLVHATPRGEDFVRGLKVTEKPGKPLSEQGLFLANEPIPRFVKESAFGITGDQPAIIILSKKTAEQAINTDKAYMSRMGKVVEMEKKLPVGFEIPAPKQRLFTRIGPGGEKVLILLDEPLTYKQIAKLKSLALVEDLKSPFSPSIMVSGMKSVNKIDDLAEAERIADVLRASGNRDTAQAFMTAYRAAARAKARADTSRGRITDTIEVRRTGRGGRTVTDTVTVRAIGTTRQELRQPGRIARADTPLTFRRNVVPTDISRLPASARGRGPSATTRIPAGTTTRVPPATVTQRIPANGRDTRPPATTRIPESPERTRIPEVPDRTRPPEILRRPPETPKPPHPPEIPRIKIRAEVHKPPAVLPKGSIAWKQGMGWWVIIPPYGIKNRFFLFREPEGVEVSVNAKSAYDTIQSFRGKGVTDAIPKHDMGVFDVHIKNPPVSPTRRNRAAIRFTRDPSVKSRRHKSGVKNRRVGIYYTSGNMVSRHPIGKRRKV